MKAEYFNIIDELPKAEDKEYRKRKKTDQIIIHHTADDHEDVGQVYNTAQRHVDKGLPGITYHFYIPWGVGGPAIYITQPYDALTYHCGMRNKDSISIALQGDFSSKGYPGKTEPSVTQSIALFALLSDLVDEKGITKVYPHSHYGGGFCPGYVVGLWIDSYMKTLEKIRNEKRIIT